MLKKTSLTFGWKYLLITALFISANISQAVTLTSGGVITMNAKSRTINDEICLDNNHNIPLLSSPITLLSLPVAEENSVIYEDAKVVSGDSKIHMGYFNQRVKLKEAGTYEATLSDFDFPVSFDMLGLSISSSTKKMGEVWNNGSFTFDADAGKYFLALFYKTDETLNLGMYGINLNYLGHPGASAVPLPASLWLMITGLMAIVGFRRKG